MHDLNDFVGLRKGLDWQRRVDSLGVVLGAQGLFENLWVGV